MCETPVGDLEVRSRRKDTESRNVVDPHPQYLIEKASHAALCGVQVDVEVRSALLANPAFELMGKNVDEDEHSIEMHLPYVAKVRDPSRTLIFVQSQPLSEGCVIWVWW